jgi:ABC-type nitrate/sulfonate/bicarbonate transport system substrate-binding protein
MTTRREFIGGGLGLGAASAAGMAVAQTAEALTVVRIAGAGQGFNWLPILVAEKQGFFAANGIKAEYVSVPSVDRATAAVREGTADIAVTPPEGAVADTVRGGPLRLYAANSLRLPMSLVVKSDIKNLAGLRGKRIGTSSLTEGTALYTQLILQRAGLNFPGDYEFVLSGIHTARWTALQKGEIDAAPQPAPWNFMAESAGYRLIGEVNEAIPEIVFGAVVGNNAWIAEHRPLMRRVLAAMSRGHDFINDPANDAVTLPIYMGVSTPNDRAMAMRGLVYTRDMGMWPKGMKFTQAAREATIDLMVKARLLTAEQRTGAHAAFDLSLLDA